MKKLIILALVFYGCNTNKLEKDLYKNEKFKVVLNIKISKDDKFQLFYTNRAKGDFNNDNKILKYVSKNVAFQKIIFELPIGVIPKKIRVDLGEKFNIDDLVIGEITIGYTNKQIKIDENSMGFYFKKNAFLNYKKDKNLNVFTPKIINGRYDPFIFSTPLLNKKIEIVF